MADVAICTPCRKGDCGDGGRNCLYEVQTPDGMVVCMCDSPMHDEGESVAVSNYTPIYRAGYYSPIGYVKE